jgi:hypothetical protein
MIERTVLETADVLITQIVMIGIPRLCYLRTELR